MSRMRKLLERHGLTGERYQELADQGCGICGTMVGNSRWERLAFDHDHSTGLFRGLLCGSCNNMIGLAGDSPERLEIAANYLRNGGTNGLVHS